MQRSPYANGIWIPSPLAEMTNIDDFSTASPGSQSADSQSPRPADSEDGEANATETHATSLKLQRLDSPRLNSTSYQEAVEEATETEAASSRMKREDSHDSKRGDSPDSKSAYSLEVADDVPKGFDGAMEAVVDATEAVVDATEAVVDATEAVVDATEAVVDATEVVEDPQEIVADSIEDEFTLVPDNTEAPIAKSKGRPKKRKIATPKKRKVATLKSALASSSTAKSIAEDKPVRKKRKSVKWEPEPASTRRADDDQDGSIEEPETVIQPVFGDDHLPSRRHSVRKLCALQNELEAHQQNGKPSPLTFRSATIIFRDVFTGIEFAMLRSELREFRPDLLVDIEKAEAADPNSVPQVLCEVATPAAVWLYVRFIRNQGVFESRFYGWDELVKAYPQLANDSFLNALLAALSMARELEDKAFEQAVVTEIDKKVRLNLQLTGARADQEDAEDAR